MRVGIIGGGQLARMLALAGYPLGIRFEIYDPDAEACAGHVAPLTVGAFDDVRSLQAFADGLDVVTFDFENVPAKSLRALAERVRVAPCPEVLEVAQDRVAEKSCAMALGIPCGNWWAIDSAEQLKQHLQDRPGDYVLKTRRLGYDGKGQVRISSERDAQAAFALADAQPCILEALVKFDRELSMIGVCGADGQRRCYPLIENVHVDGVLRSSSAPAAVSDGTRNIAERYLDALAGHFGYVGVLAIEFFQVGNALIFNEMAPRVHNSGHWTIEGAVCSQFENHLRAILGWPLGETSAIGSARMQNIVGMMPERSALLSDPSLHLHDYGKSERLGRKLGHMTRVLDFFA